MCAVRHQDVTLYLSQLGVQLLEDWHEAQIDKYVPVCGMIHDIDELFGE